MRQIYLLFLLFSLVVYLAACTKAPIPKRFEGKYRVLSTRYSYGQIPECCVQNSGCECWDTLVKKDTFFSSIKEQEDDDIENLVLIGSNLFVFSDVKKGVYHYYLTIPYNLSQDPHLKYGEAYIKAKHFQSVVLSKLNPYWDSIVYEGNMVK